MKKTLFIIISIVTAMHSFGQCLSSEQSFKDYFTKNISTNEPIEGIWSLNLTVKIYNQYNQLISNEYSPQISKVVIIRDGDKFKTCALNDNHGGSTAIFVKTATTGVYLFQTTFAGSYAVAKSTAIIDSEGFLQYSLKLPTEHMQYEMGEDQYPDTFSTTAEIKLIKLFPSFEDIQKFAPSSGTGFALSTDGYILTNHHVVNNASNINIRGINGDFSKRYKAKLIVEDKNNDIAIIKIDDIGFISTGNIPYVISTKSSDVGTSIFCLGYPLRSTMGDEVKLTNGIISSKSGFQGDITTYQISAPVQPGNSGGPLFNNQGNLIGIINAKHTGAENVSYGVKSSYLNNLIELLASPPKLQKVNLLTGKSLTQQVELVKKFVYIIETE